MREVESFAAQRHAADGVDSAETLRDLRELTRTRLVLVAQRTRLKNRLSATLAKYGTRQRMQRSLRQTRARGDGKTSATVAGTDALGE